jgi:hypothetical protein
MTHVDFVQSASLSMERVMEEQRKEFGDVKDMVGDHGRFLVGEDSLLYRVFTETDNRIVVPRALRGAVLKLENGSSVVGHWGVFEDGSQIAEAILVDRLV